MKTILLIALCNLLCIGVYILFYVLVSLAVSGFTKIIGEQRIGFALFLSIFNMTNRIVVLVLGAIEIILNSSIIVTLYLKYTKKEKKVYYISSYKKKKSTIPLRFKRGMFLVGAGIICWNTFAIYFMLSEQSAMIDMQITQITSHRGNSSEAPENTLPALEYAVRDLAEYAEIDVQQTKDGEVVLFHDYTMKRVFGSNSNISKKTYAELLELDAGEWFSKDFVGTKICTLREAIEYCKGKIKLNIELKPKYSKNLAEEVVKILEEYDFVNSCIVSSFSKKELQKIKQFNEEVKTGYILSAVYGQFYKMEGIDFFSIEQTFVTEKLVETLHKNGKEIHVWTVNKKADMERLAMLGVDSIITDKPLLARQVIYSETIPEYTLNLMGLIFER